MEKLKKEVQNGNSAEGSIVSMCVDVSRRDSYHDARADMSDYSGHGAKDDEIRCVRIRSPVVASRGRSSESYV